MVGNIPNLGGRNEKIANKQNASIFSKDNHGNGDAFKNQDMS
jgi:hypothetical protein